MRPVPSVCTARLALGWGLLMSAALLPAQAGATDFPVTTAQRDTAQRVATAGVPLSELAPDAPDSYTVKRGDTLWDISKLFLRSPWRWPELWGMNLEQIRNPHLIYPGQHLVLIKADGMARLAVARPVGAGMSQDTQTRTLGPRVRESALAEEAVAAVSLRLIGPFLNEAVILEADQMEQAPRIVATQAGRMMVSRGESAYVRGAVDKARNWSLYREARPLLDPDTRELLGYEARYVGSAEVIAQGDSQQGGKQSVVIPSTISVTYLREEAGVGDRLAPQPARDLEGYMPHAPNQPLSGKVVGIYGDALTAGQNQIVTLNRGTEHGLERGHVLSLWRAGAKWTDRTSEDRAQVVVPHEKHGLLFVFRVFRKMSYALIVNVQQPVSPGDTFSQP
ncbi:LysM peptidoglycan-binding domain-containing protein [Ideonella livida]|uniref:LysM peptidoglycan-binding domain-containing protein n=1 Tax=Ideonella livida TaxID=2707176 RepID=A0A7C9PHF8_9BURK|nr:LysM domain-containing protein [Ideonella livida]NDY91134.1 LysM peptidoglycan-binding domain-containing protein [Ideonella livida]